MALVDLVLGFENYHLTIVRLGEESSFDLQVDALAENSGFVHLVLENQVGICPGFVYKIL